MPRLAQFRTGWENENFAQFILSRFSFIARPISVGDDVGSDFFCTLFQRLDVDDDQYLIPRISYAIQVKSYKHVVSDRHRIDITEKTGYLKSLEIPFFIGVVNNQENTLSIYSGELIPRFFSYRANPTRLRAVLCERRKWIEKRPEDDKWDLDFPFVAKLAVDTGEDTLKQFVDEFLELCLLMRANLSARFSKHYFFKTPLPDGEMDIRLYAGEDSARTFRDNFYECLTEVFNHLNWQITYHPESFRDEEFVAYEKLYLELRDLGQNFPDYLEKIYNRTLVKRNERNAM